ncbi:uncharacterized protein [Rutidosis leptorrhynchoides]|uniref:uncharacterized protein n=1 Tax=Rutidosis leptorrhynchoides TaxID=125765 RepID=UPI003A9A25E7
MGGLTSLQTLSKVIIEKGSGFKVSDLKDMSNLQGDLIIDGLDEVTDPQQAMDANLMGKKGLVSLEMYWTYSFDDSRNSILEYEVPSSFEKLTQLTIEDCPNLVELSIGLISTLEYLFIYNCKKLVSIGENVGSSNRKSVLREVRFSGCDSLESYICANTVEKLWIEDCDTMTSVSMSTTFKELPLSLRSLEVDYCKNLKSLFHEQLQSLTSLEKMMIISCENMNDSFPSGLWPPNLRKLIIGELKKPMSEWGLQNCPTSLVELSLHGDDSGITSFATEGDATNTASTSFLLPPSLTSLYIWNFNDVESISEVVKHLTHLQELDIWKCPNIKDVPQSNSSLTVNVCVLSKTNSQLDPNSTDGALTFILLDALFVTMELKLSNTYLYCANSPWKYGKESVNGGTLIA